MANPNRKPEQDWRERGWEAIPGGQSERPDKDKTIGADYTRSPYDPTLRSDLGRNSNDPLLSVDPRIDDDPAAIDDPLTRADASAPVVRDASELHPLIGPEYERRERNVPEAYDRDELRNPDENPMTVLPARPGGTLRTLGIVLLILLFAALVALMFMNWNRPAPRHAQATTPQTQAAVAHNDATTKFAAFVARMNERHAR